MWVKPSSTGRQGPTIQADLNLPERFDIHYIGEDGQRHRPVMIHRTVLGAMERCIGGLLEHYGGAFPMWLSPVQIRVIPVTDRQAGYAKAVAGHLAGQGFRTECDLGPDKIGYKIRQAQLEKVPYMIIVGDKEKEAGNISVRHRGLGDLGNMELAEFAGKVKQEALSKSLESAFVRS